MQKPSDRKKYNAAFEKTLEQLNTQQATAVNQVEGPVLVVAGPGTGKTHILSARIGRILQQTDVFAHNILCLTFTDAGVLAMRERLTQFIGPEAHRVHIYTFHSFCNSIIQENLELFGRHDLEPLSELERVEIIRRMIDELPFDHALKKGRSDVYFYENHLFDLFKRMKSEDWSVAYLHQQIEVFLDSLPTREEYIYKRKSGKFQKGDIKEAKLEDSKLKMEKLAAAVSLFPKYEHYLHQMRRYDFDDMILWVLRAFENNPLLLRNYQERYLYLLVDEYQDTNGAQNTILQQLMDYWENPNIFIVGDDDQSIYEFQGARLRNITDFYDKFRNHVELVLLEDNYRSSQTILDTSAALIDENQKRLINALGDLKLEKHLEAQNETFAQSKRLPKIVSYKNRLQEDTDIVAQIEQLNQANFPLNEVAIIYAQHRQINNIVALLEKKGIPYFSKKRINILHEPLIQNLRTLLEYLVLEHHNPTSGEHLIYQILHFDFLNITASDLLKMSVFMAKNRMNYQQTWRVLLSDEKQLKILGLDSVEQIKQFSDCLFQWSLDYVNESLPILVERIVNQSGLIGYVLQHEQKMWYLQLVKTFFDFVKKEANRKPKQNLRDFLEVLIKMDANRLSIPINRAIYAKNGVQLVTAHSSKGLEFQKVFIIDAVKDFWEPKSRGGKQFTYPDTVTLSGEEDEMEARRRLFYVAMTRAKEQLHISYSETNNEEKPLQRAVFLDEIFKNTANIELIEKELPIEDLLEAQGLLLLENQNPKIDLPDKDMVHSLLEGLVLSVSALNRYLKCPLSFYYEYILRVPSLMSTAAAYGTAMHFALMKLFDKMMESETKSFPSEQAFIQYFEKEMIRQEVHFSKKEYHYRLKKGRSVLAAYYQQSINLWPIKVNTELEIKNVEVEGVPIKGVIDRVDLIDAQTAHIEDYKTGSTDKKKLKKPTDKKPLGGNYWRQLVFYKVLYESALPSLHTIRSGAIAYLEPDHQGVFSTETIDLTFDDAEYMKGLIKDTWSKIQQHEFSEGCGERNCVWCDFIKNNRTPNSFSDPEIEALDD